MAAKYSVPSDTITFTGTDTLVPANSTLNFLADFSSGPYGSGTTTSVPLGSVVTASDGSYSFTTTTPVPSGENYLYFVGVSDPSGNSIQFLPDSGSASISSTVNGVTTLLSVNETTVYNPSQQIDTNNGGGNTHPGSVNNGGGNLHPGSGGVGNLGATPSTGYLLPLTS
jgi:hypothetical protein